MVKRFHAASLIILVLICSGSVLSQESDTNKYNRTINPYPYRINELTVIGRPDSYTVKEEDTFLDIARDYELGFNEMTALYPKTDPWMPTPGETIAIPASWIIPPTKSEPDMIGATTPASTRRPRAAKRPSSPMRFITRSCGM